MTFRVAYFDPRKPFIDAGKLARDAFVRLNDLINRTGGEKGLFMAVPSRTVAELQAMAANEQDRPKESAVALCSDESGGATLAFYSPDDLAWRRSQDRAIIS